MSTRPLLPALIPPLLILLAGSGPGCASVPEFHPSRPLDRAGSPEEGLLGCNEFHLPVPAARPILLRPWLQCLDEAVERHPPAPLSPVGPFLREFHQLYDSLHEIDWTPRLGAEIEVAAHALLRYLWRGGGGAAGSFSAAEREYVLRHFPDSALRADAAAWKITSGARVDPGLEALVAGLASFRDPPGTVAGAPDPDLCKRLALLRSEVDYLTALWEDGNEMLNLNTQESIAGWEHLRPRYLTRVAQATSALDGLRPEVAAARATRGGAGLFCPAAPREDVHARVH